MHRFVAGYDQTRYLLSGLPFVNVSLGLLEPFCQLLRTATQIKDRVDNNSIRFDHIEDSEGVSRDQQPAISTSIKAAAQGVSRKLFEPGLYGVKEGRFFPVSMFSSPILGLLQVLFRRQEENNLHYSRVETILCFRMGKPTQEEKSLNHLIELANCRELSPIECLCIGLLNKLMEKNGYAYASNKQLAHWLGLQPEGVRPLLRRLESRGKIEDIGKNAFDGGRLSAFVLASVGVRQPLASVAAFSVYLFLDCHLDQRH